MEKKIERIRDPTISPTIVYKCTFERREMTFLLARTLLLQNDVRQRDSPFVVANRVSPEKTSRRARDSSCNGGSTRRRVLTHFYRACPGESFDFNGIPSIVGAQRYYLATYVASSRIQVTCAKWDDASRYIRFMYDSYSLYCLDNGNNKSINTMVIYNLCYSSCQSIHSFVIVLISLYNFTYNIITDNDYNK